MSVTLPKHLSEITIKGETHSVPPLVAECYARFLPGMQRLPKPEEWALFYAGHAARAIATKQPLHLSRKREKAPVTADIGPNGDLFIAWRHSCFSKSDDEMKKVKKASDVIRQKTVIRSVERENEYTQEHLQAEREAQEDFADAPWMVKEYFRGAYSNELFDKFVKITDLMEGGDLFNFIKDHDPLELSDMKKIMHQLLQQLEQIHRKGIHKDLKTENIFMTKDLKISIADFGFYIRHNDRTRLSLYRVGTTFTHSPEFAAKELRGNSDFTDVNTPGYDVWAMGLIFFELYYWNKYSVPWIELKEAAMLERIATTHCSWLPNKNSREPIHVLMRNLLAPDPKERLSARQALEYFEKEVLPDRSPSSKTNPPQEKAPSPVAWICDADHP